MFPNCDNEILHSFTLRIQSQNTLKLVSIVVHIKHLFQFLQT